MGAPHYVLLSMVAILAVALLDAWFRVIRHRNGTRVLEGDIARTRQQLAHVGEQRALLAEVLQELVLLRNGLVESGIAERSGRPPPPATFPPPGYSRPPVPLKSRPPPASAAPPSLPAGKPPAAGGDADPPSTKPSHSHEVPLARSSPRPVCFDDQVRRALARMENRIEVPAHLEERWLARLRALGAELDISESDGPTEDQVKVMVRELYHADADARDGRDAPKARPVMKTLVSATDATLLRGGARPEEEPEETRDTEEEFTRVLSREPDAADAQIPGLVVVSKRGAGRTPHRPPRKLEDPLAGVTPEADAFARSQRPTLFGGLAGGAAPRPTRRAPEPADEEGGDTP